jgi:hypothetical protein
MGLIAPVLMAIVAFYWVAGCFTIIAWLKAISNLCFGNFIRAAIWFNVGNWMLFWWFDKPHGWEDFMPGACFFVGIGALATLARYLRRALKPTAQPLLQPWSVEFLAPKKLVTRTK